MLLQKVGITECNENLHLDYIKMKLFPHEKMIQMKGFDEKNTYIKFVLNK